MQLFPVPLKRQQEHVILSSSQFLILQLLSRASIAEVFESDSTEIKNVILTQNIRVANSLFILYLIYFTYSLVYRFKNLIYR
jgi:hypothetical protein